MSEASLRTMLITGAAGGIGRATVQYFSEMGWRVIGVDRTEFGDPRQGAKREPFPETGLFIRADISEPSDIHKIYTAAAAFSPTLNAVVNNAAVQIIKPLLDTTPEEWDRVMASNLRSVFLVTKLAHPLLKAGGGGAIVNVSSVHAVATSPNIASYVASKGGLLALTRAMAIEFAMDDIRVNAILPGAVDTPMLRGSMQRDQHTGGTMSDRLENLARKTVNGRIGQPIEIAHAIYFLADSSMSSFMTGQALIVDGGATARLSTE